MMRDKQVKIAKQKQVWDLLTRQATKSLGQFSLSLPYDMAAAVDQ
jgi:hypothetical protein